MGRHEVEAPVPGTFYRRPDPKSDPFVEEGDDVSAEQTIGLIEVMKQFQELEAEAEGKVVEFLVSDDEQIESGQTIAIIEDE
jgi:acetyl-CoA carboxylase biotin carboxyl carrier protein